MATVQRHTAARAAVRPLSGPALQFDLLAEAEALRGEPEWGAPGRNARTLAKYPESRLVLEVMRSGTRFAPNGPSERISLQCLAGRVRIHLPDWRVLEVAGGGLCTLDRFMAIEVEAVEDSTCLLTISWPGTT